MRLLNVTTLQVEHFSAPTIPPYAILSHTHGRDEMTLQEMETIARHRLTRQQQIARIVPRTPDKADAMRMLLLSSMLTAFRGGSSPLNNNRPPTPPSITDSFPSVPPPPSAFEKALVPASLHSSHVLELKAGFAKVSYACGQAQREGLQYIWIDTCCLDASSSSDISEAVNSMWAWYASATTCYAYLEDVQHGGGHRGGYRVWKDDFVQSRWFRRGWTLQELLAPRAVTFFGAGWKQLGTKASLARTVEKATGIERRVLLEPRLVFKTSVARRMAWAAHRTTARPEDVAYALMGVFGVNMMPLYGEGGENAFLRLQEEIIRRSGDQTIFAWGILGQEDKPVIHHTGLEEFDDDAASATMSALARSPRDFAGMNRVVCAPPTTPQDAADYGVTNRGVRVRLNVIQVGTSSSTTDGGQKYFLAALDCRDELEDPQDRLGILLAETDVPNVFVRTRTRKHTRVSGEDLEGAKPRAMYISTSAGGFVGDASQEEKVVVRASDLISPGYDIIDIQSKQAQWNREFATMRVAGMVPPPPGSKQGVVYQLAVLVFFNRHLLSGFVARIFVDAVSDECWVDLVPPPPPVPAEERRGMSKEEEEDVELNQLRAQAKMLWNNPGRVNLPRTKVGAGGKTTSVVQTVEVVNPEILGDEEDDQSVRGKSGGPVEVLRGGVLFEEKWEKVYHRMVEAKVERKKKGVISLEMTSMLFAA
ncbi:vegetative incompatibility protein HET-E-1 [Echria macrotheca]|uniref:Vegetative incompatibility protein HET-E-1 n=1 Tax=Echria macrotheca TaxID=438768 RepID=A0AAJ0B6T7_9PEZI|nr:vegetative incompatibility protein HET-E-1 [Echria macrotheca]